MKQIKNASELKEGQKYLIELEYRKGQNKHYPYCFFDEINNTKIFSTTSTLKFDTDDISPLHIYEKQEIELPVIGKYYEFSADGVGWYKGKLKGYVSHNGARVFDRIRNETINQKELEAIEYLMFLGYKIEK